MPNDQEPPHSTGKDWGDETPAGPLICSIMDCKNDLHWFRRRGSKDRPYRNEICVGCGASRVDWGRLDKRDFGDRSYTVQALNYEWIRNHFWKKPVEEKIAQKACSKGIEELQDWTISRLEKVVRRPQKDLWRDGTQTPFYGNIVFYAQHGTATCCRKCIEEWHGIERNTRIVGEDLEYFTKLIMMFTTTKLPSITRKGKA